MRVALRHARARRGDPSEPCSRFGELRIDLARREVTVAATEVHLTPIEFKLLALLAQHAGKVLTHRQILQEVWGPTHVEQTHYLRVHMAELRKKIEADPARPQLARHRAGGRLSAARSGLTVAHDLPCGTGRGASAGPRRSRAVLNRRSGRRHG